jgi:hypothetical protein
MAWRALAQLVSIAAGVAASARQASAICRQRKCLAAKSVSGMAAAAKRIAAAAAATAAISDRKSINHELA